jgi:hypothetical protein
MNIFEKISEVMRDIEYLAKDDKVITNQKTNAGYKAISEEKVTSTVRDSLIRNGIVIIPIKQEHRREDEITKTIYEGTVTEKTNRIATVDVTYRIQNIQDKDDYIDAVSSGTGVDTQDKGVGKAMTYAYKYLLLRTFAIPTGEDPDKISSETYTNDLNKANKSYEDKKLEMKIEETKSKLVTPQRLELFNKQIVTDKITDAQLLQALSEYEMNSTSDIKTEEDMANVWTKLCKIRKEVK